MSVLIDTLDASEKLKEAGFKKAQAKALIKALSPKEGAIVSNKDLEAAMHKLKAEIIVWMVGLHIASVSLLISFLG